MLGRKYKAGRVDRQSRNGVVYSFKASLEKNPPAMQETLV